jgi:quinol monooxygenase YgiN
LGGKRDFELQEEARAMSYGRITHIQPLPGREQEVSDLLDEYLEWLVNREGFLLGLNLQPNADSHPIARVLVWADSAEADATAVTDHALAVRSHLMGLAIDQTIHEEEYSVRAFKAPNWA